MADAKIKLYTNYGCPSAHRAHIALAELGLPYEEHIVDLSVPRTPEYLAINPRGLVPSLSYNGQIITESAIVAQFLADAYPATGNGGLVPPSNSVDGALKRARMGFFVDAWVSKVVDSYHKSLLAKTEEEGESHAEEAKKAIAKEIEPLLAGAGPFFEGSDRLTLAEVLTAPFVLRIFVFTKHGILTPALTKGLTEEAPNFYKWAQAVINHPSVNSIFDEEENVRRYHERMAKIRAQA